MSNFFRVEDLKVYQRLCDLHIEVCTESRTWPPEEKYELGSQVRRSSNSSPANLAEKHSDRHVKNKIEGVNRARGELLETVHHLYVAMRKGYLTQEQYFTFRGRYDECVRMLNGLERTLERKLDPSQRRWPEVPESDSPAENEPELPEAKDSDSIPLSDPDEPF